MKRHTQLRIWQLVAVVAVILLIYMYYQGGNPVTGGLSSDQAGEDVLTFVNDNLLQGNEASLTEVEDLGAVYRIVLNINGQDVDTFATKDGNYFFPAGYSIEEFEDLTDGSDDGTDVPTDVPQTDKPVVELFVMSHCPYGTQAEKGMIPVAELLGDNVDFNIRYVNYAMHGEVEVVEELNQYCIQTEQSDLFIPYLTCFLEEGDSEGCFAEVGVDETALADCYARVDTEFGIMASLADQSTWSGGRFPPFAIHDDLNKQYGVRGSPTLVVNGVQVSSGRDSASYLKAICAAFNEEPSECAEELSSASPSAGFGWDGSGSGSTASCS